MYLNRIAGLILALIVGIGGQDYIWPTANSQRISSNFGEFRTDHFHMGLDIKTNGISGIPVLAVADGYIARMNASFFGYGKALYLNTTDGQTIVYGHLERFAPLLAEVLKNQQKKVDSYNVRMKFKPGEFPVRKGEIIAYSGNSGGSFAPHLHFEVRDQQERVLNPVFHGFPVPDKLAPIIEAIVFNPLASGTLIEASPLPQVFPVFRDLSGSYTLPDTLNVFGMIGIGLQVHDRALGTGNKYNIHRIELWLDDQLQYRLVYDSLNFDQERLLNTVEDYRLQRLQNRDFHKLYRLPVLPAVSVNPAGDSGVLQLAPGPHQLLIKVFDCGGNSARLQGVLLALPPLELTAELIRKTDRSLTFELKTAAPVPLKDVTCYAFTPYGFADQKIQFTSLQQNGTALQVTLPRAAVRNRVLQFIGRNQLGVATKPCHWDQLMVPRQLLDIGIDLKISQIEKGVFLQVTTSEYIASRPEIKLRSRQTDQTVILEEIRPNVYLSALIAPARFAALEAIIVRLDGTPLREIRFPFQGDLTRPGQTTVVVTADRNCSVQTTPNSFYDETVIWIEPVEIPVDTHNGQRLAPVYQLQPFDIPLRDSLRVAIRYDERHQHADRKAIYYYDRKGKWNFLPSQERPDRQTLIASLQSLEAVTILRDTLPPVIETIYPAHGGHYHYQDVQTLFARLDDDLSGIAPSETTLLMVLDGRKLLFAYQPILKELSYTLDVPLDVGDHELIVSATDQVGNSTTRKISFSVD
ncbi:MAG: hypothetical protein ABIA75_12640 [Candidatus Neomarinimicrobiota bacterium]